MILLVTTWWNFDFENLLNLLMNGQVTGFPVTARFRIWFCHRNILFLPPNRGLHCRPEIHNLSFRVPYYFVFLSKSRLRPILSNNFCVVYLNEVIAKRYSTVGFSHFGKSTKLGGGGIRHFQRLLLSWTA